MDDDLLYTNTFIETSQDFTRKMDSVGKTPVLSRSKTNPVIDDDFKLRLLAERTVNKELRTIISLNSNQRNLTFESELTDASDYIDYMSSENYTEFKSLYDLAKGLNRTVQTYSQYVKLYGDITIEPTETIPALRNVVNGLLQAESYPTTPAEINLNYQPLLTIPLVNTNTRANYESIANGLNSYVMSGTSFRPDAFWRPFYFTGYTDSTQPSIKQIIFREATASNYSVILPSIIRHVKSIRLTSSEIPGCLNTITERNNIITLQLQYKPPNFQDYQTVPLSKDNLFNFILILLDIGNYTVESLAVHLESKLNEACKLYTLKRYADLFQVLFIKETGEFKIICKRQEVNFHLKFYSEFSGLIDVYNPSNPLEKIGKTQGIINSYWRDLWFLLGFPWPYEINKEGTDKFTSLLTNKISIGPHSVLTTTHVNNDIFDRTLALTTKETVLNTIMTLKPFKYPDLSIRYIYLVIKGFKALQHVNQFNSFIGFKNADIFAKVQILNDQICFNSFVINPLVFLNVISDVASLQISWIDESGNLVDFNGSDHSFTLEFIHYVTQVDANLYNSALGNIDKKSYPEWLLGCG